MNRNRIRQNIFREWRYHQQRYFYPYEVTFVKVNEGWMAVCYELDKKHHYQPVFS